VTDQVYEPTAGRSAGLVVAPEPFASPVAQRFVAELEADMVVRYEVDVTAPGYEGEEDPHWTVRAEQVTPPAGVFVVAWLDRVPVGSGAVRPLPGGPAGVGEVKRMYTEPRARRRGVSRAILAYLETTAVGFGYRRLQLETGARQPEALALYDSTGWHRITPYGQYRGDEFSICFAKDIG
jgi:GNAT superfamily N-acetyltransferase